MTDEAQTFTQEDIDGLNAKHQEEITALQDRLKAEYERKADGLAKKVRAEIEEEAKKAKMTELEKANTEIEELTRKNQEFQDTIALTTQKDDTRKLMSELGVDEKCLDYVFVPKDMEATKARAKSFKEYIDEVKKNTFEKNVGSNPPGTGGANPAVDAMRKAAGLK